MGGSELEKRHILLMFVTVITRTQQPKPNVLEAKPDGSK